MQIWLAATLALGLAAAPHSDPADTAAGTALSRPRPRVAAPT